MANGKNLKLRTGGISQAVRHWTETRSCKQLMVHVTNGENAEDAVRFFRRCGMVTVV
jgi:hypothetical protein